MSYNFSVDHGALIKIHYNNLNTNFAELEKAEIEKKDDYDVRTNIINEINKLKELLPANLLPEHKVLDKLKERIILTDKRAQKDWKERIGPAIEGIIPTEEEMNAQLEEMNASKLESKPKATQPSSQKVSKKTESIDDLVEEEVGKSEDEELDFSILDMTITPHFEEDLKENIDTLGKLLNTYKLLESDQSGMVQKVNLKVDALIDLKIEIAVVINKLKALLKNSSEPITKLLEEINIDDRTVMTNAIMKQLVAVLDEARQFRTPSKKAIEGQISRESKDLVTLAETLNGAVLSYRTKVNKEERAEIGNVIKHTLEAVAAIIRNSKFNDLKQLIANVTSAKLSNAQLETIEDISLKMTLVSGYLKTDEAEATTDAEVATRAEQREISVIEAMEGLNDALENYKESPENGYIYLKLVQIREFSSDKQTQDTVSSILTNIPFKKTLSNATVKSIDTFIKALAKKLEKA